MPRKPVTPMSAEALKHSMEANQLPPTATEQAIGGRQATGTTNPGDIAAKEKPDESGKPEQVATAAKPKKAKKTSIRPIVEKIYVRHDFIEGEFAEMARQLGIQQRQALETEAQLKSIKSDFKARMDKIGAEINRLSNAVNDGYVMREVESLVLVAIHPKDKTGQKCYYERSGGKFIKAEPFSLDGQQLDMFAMHPKPLDFKKKLSDKIIKSAV